jgi:site-specific recombinase XerD
LYLATLTDLAKYHHQSPDTLDPTQVQNFQLYLTQERHLAWSSVSVAASAIRFFYTHAVKRLDLAMAMPSRRKPQRLPRILSVDEVERARSIPRHPTHRVLLMTTCAAGFRVSEVVRLQLTDLDREQLMIRVEQEKRRTDRYTILSPRLLTELDRYRAQRSLTRWLFPARMGEQPMSTSTAQHIFIAAKARAGIQKPGSVHLLHAFATHLLEIGVDLWTIQVLFGHASLATTSCYLHATRKTLDAVQSPFDHLTLSTPPAAAGPAFGTVSGSVQVAGRREAASENARYVPSRPAGRLAGRAGRQSRLSPVPFLRVSRRRSCRLSRRTQACRACARSSGP